MPSYNLVDCPFIFATYKNGTVKEVGLRELFLNIDDVVRVGGDSEFQEFPLMRVLIAILYGSIPVELLSDEKKWREIWKAGFNNQLSSGETISHYVEEYLQKYYHRFDLGGETPFMGVMEAEYEKENPNYSLANLFIDNLTLQSSEKTHYSTKSQSFYENLKPAMATRALIELQAYRTGSKKSILKGDPRIIGGKRGYAQPGWTGFLGGILLKGANLSESLILNLPPYTTLYQSGEDSTLRDKDLSSWERTQDTIAPIRALYQEEKIGASSGPKELLTHQAARVKLLWNSQGDKIVGAIIGIGDRIFTQDNHLTEPHSTQYLVKAAADKTVTYFRPKKLGARGFWRGFASLIVPQFSDNIANVKQAPNLANYENNYNYLDLPILKVSYFELSYGTQDAIVEDISVSEATLPAHIYEEPIYLMVSEAVRKVDEILSDLRNFQNNVAASLSSKPPLIQESVSENFLFIVGNEFNQWITNIDQSNLKASEKEWTMFLKKVTTETLDTLKEQYPAAAFFPSPTRTHNKRAVLSVSEAENIFWYNLIKKKGILI